MLLMKPFEIAPLEWIYNNIKILFPPIMAIGQMAVTFFAAYGIILVINYVKNKYQKK